MSGIVTKNIRVAFFGTPPFAVPAFRTLIKEHYTIVATVTAPDKPVGRKKELTPPPVKISALEYGIPVLQPETLKDEEFFTQFRESKPDICIVVAYGKIIPERYLAVPKYGFLNIHPSLLPKYRGPSPIQSALLEGERETGVSIMVLDTDVDHGPVLAAHSMEIPADMHYPELSEILAKTGANLLVEMLPAYISGALLAQPQNHSKATFTKMLALPDGQMDWKRPTAELYNQTRALNPEPGAWTRWNGSTLRIIWAQPMPANPGTPGEPGIVIKMNDSVAVRTGDGFLKLKEIQKEGSRVMKIKDFINGNRNFISAKLET